jgi:large subunit ribosomal protein L22
MTLPTPVQQSRAEARFIRITARKIRLVVDAIRGHTVKDAEEMLKFIPKGASVPVAKLLKSAKANATNNFDMLEDNLFVKTVFVNEGPSLKRILPRARGRGDYMVKRTSHIIIILEEKQEPVRKSRKVVATKAAAPVEAAVKPKRAAKPKAEKADASSEAAAVEKPKRTRKPKAETTEVTDG